MDRLKKEKAMLHEVVNLICYVELNYAFRYSIDFNVFFDFRD